MTWMSLEDTLLIERSQSQKDEPYTSSLLSKLRDRKWRVGAGAWGGQMGHSCCMGTVLILQDDQVLEIG